MAQAKSVRRIQFFGALAAGVGALSIFNSAAFALQVAGDPFISDGSTSESGFIPGNGFGAPVAAVGSTAVTTGAHNGISLSGSALNLTGATYATDSTAASGASLSFNWQGSLQNTVNFSEFLNCSQDFTIDLVPGSGGHAGAVSWTVVAAAGDPLDLVKIDAETGADGSVGPSSSELIQTITGNEFASMQFVNFDAIEQGAGPSWEGQLVITWTGFDPDSVLNVTVPAVQSIDESITTTPLPEPGSLGILCTGGLLAMRRRRT